MIEYEIKRIKYVKIHILEKKKYKEVTKEMKRKELKEKNKNMAVGAGPVSAQISNKNANVGVAWHATQRGITLISLIITIILLLILAGVALNLTIGENGIFRLARNAVNRYENEAIKEEHELSKVTNEIGEYVNGSRNIEELQLQIEELKSKLNNVVGFPDYTNRIKLTSETQYTADENLYIIIDTTEKDNEPR